MAGFHNIYGFAPPQSDDPKVLKNWAQDVATKLNRAFTDVQRVTGEGAGNTTVIVGGSSGTGGSGSGSASSVIYCADEVAVTADVESLIAFSTPFSVLFTLITYGYVDNSNREQQLPFSITTAVSASGFGVTAIESGTFGFFAIGKR